MLLPLLAVLSTMRYEGTVTAAGGAFAEVAFEVPVGTVEIRIAHADGGPAEILDWGVWGPDGFRGWGGGNTEPAVIGVAESSRSYLPGPIAPGTWRVVIGKAQLGAGGGSYVIDVVCDDAATLVPRSRAAFAPVVLAGERRWYRGDFHVHSSESGDADAPFAQIVELARARGLDFVNLSDHNTSAQLALQAAVQAGVPDVLLLRGAEVTTYAGHGNAVGLDSYVDHRVGFAGRTMREVVADVVARGALFIVNHPTLDLGDACIGCAWQHADTPWDQVGGIEIITGDWATVERLFVPRAIAMWDALEDQGFRLAPVGGSDDHRAGLGTSANDGLLGSPTTLVRADELSEAALIAGVRAGRTIVQLRGPDDPRIEFRLGDADIGDEVTGVERARLAVRVEGGAGMFVQLWRDGAKLATAEVTSADFRHTFEDVPGAAAHRYRIELLSDANQRIVVTGHIYVVGAAASDGCGCGAAAGGGAGAGWLAGLVALVAWVGLRRRASAARPGCRDGAR